MYRVQHGTLSRRIHNYKSSFSACCLLYIVVQCNMSRRYSGNRSSTIWQNNYSHLLCFYDSINY